MITSSMQGAGEQGEGDPGHPDPAGPEGAVSADRSPEEAAGAAGQSPPIGKPF